MSESVTSLDWRRLIIEGLVIVVSILMAFTIDAWWDQQREARDANDQVARVIAELRANVAILEDQDRSLNITTQAGKDLLSLMGPDPQPVSTQEIGALIGHMFSVPTLSLSKSATQNFLSSGQLTGGRWVEVRLALTEMLSHAQSTENSSLELRQMRPSLLERMQLFVSGLDIVNENPFMENYPASRFDSDTDALLSDRTFEGFVASYAIRMEINRFAAQSSLDKHNALIDMIENKP